MDNNLKFSIIIPTYNEEADIARTLDSLIALDYDNKEIIIVDDSTDNTPSIVRGYKDNGVSLIKPEVRKGRCEARNIGVKASVGDVIIILNADVLLPSDFISKIKIHYDNGLDAVGVMNLVENLDSVYSRYVGMHNHRKEEKGVFEERKEKLNDLWWTEGFSVKRNFLMKTSLFPSGYIVPIVAGEDVRFVDELRKLGCKGVFDKGILIKHVAPSTFKEYWQIRKGRGAGTPQIRLFIDGWSKGKLFTVLLLKSGIRFAKFITLYPMIKYALELSKFSTKNRFLETIKMAYCWAIEQTAFTVGEFQSLFNILKKEKELKK